MPARFHETALSRQHSFLSSMRSLLPGRFGSHPNLAAVASSASPSKTSLVTASPEQIVSMTSLSSTCLYTISRDRKLRIWSIPSNTCLETLQLPQNPTTMEIVPSITSAELERENSREPSLLSSVPIPLMRLFPNGGGSGTSQYLLVHIPTSQVQTSFFILYSLTFDDRGRLLAISPVLEKPCDFGMDDPSSTSYLGDFQVLPGKSGKHVLWTLWNESGQTLVRYSNLDLSPSSDALALPDPDETMASLFPPVSESWHLVSPSLHQINHSLDITAAAFDRAYAALRSDLDSANLSTPELAHQITLCAKEACVDSFIEQLFCPGRYPTSAISAALLSYIKTLTRTLPRLRLPTRPNGPVSLAQQILDVVGSQIGLQEDTMTGALKEDEYIKAYKLELMKVLALAEENKRSAKQPLSLGVSVTRDLLVFAKGAVASPVETAWPVAITQLSDNQSIRTPLEMEIVPAVAAFYKLARDTTSHLRKVDSFMLATFEDAAARAVTNSATVAIEDIATDIFQDIYESLIDEETHLDFSAQVKQIHLTWQQLAASSSNGVTSPSLASLALLAIKSLAGSPVASSARGNNGSTIFGQTGLAGLVIDNASEDLHIRYDQSLSLLIVTLFLQHGMAEPPSPETEESDEDQDNLISDEESLELLSQALDTFKGFTIANWLANHNLAITDLKLELSDAEEDTADDLMTRLRDMRFQGSALPGNFARPESVLASLLDSASDDILDALDKARSLSAASQAFLHSLGLLGWEQLSAGTLAPIVSSLIAQQQGAEASLLVSRTPERDEDAALLHLQGLIACRKGDIDGALLSFNKVAAAVCKSIMYLFLPLRLLMSHAQTLMMRPWLN